MGEGAGPADPVAAAVDGAPFRPVHLWLFLASVGGTLINGYTVFVTGVVVPLVTRQFTADPDDIGLFSSALVLGAVGGSLVGGRLSDRVGRKDVYLGDMLLITVAALVLGMAQTMTSLTAAQLLLGFGIGMDFPVAAAYVTETMPARQRRMMVVATIAFQAVGLVLGATIAAAIAIRFPAEQNWRWILGSTALLAMIWFMFRLSVPESPHWYAARGQWEAAKEVLARLAPTATLGPAPASSLGASPEVGFATLFSAPYLRITILTAGSWALMDIATYGVGIFTPDILAAVEPRSHLGLFAKEVHDAEMSGFVDAFLVVGSMASIWIVHRFGAIPVQVVGFVGMAIGMAVLAWAASVGPSAPPHTTVLLLGFALFNLAQNAGPNATTFTLPPLLYPTALRATGAGFASAFAKVGATLGALFLPGMESTYGPPSVLMGLAVVSLLALCVTLLFRPRHAAGNGAGWNAGS
ncbi:MAG: MFS transporter [Geminicoccaceae bacterium]